jgi:CheY-like chemotaxis protein
MSKKKILLVDDSATVLMMEQMLLRNFGYEVVTAKNGHEGVLKAKTELPDLILLDVVMPKMDGVEACRLLRAQPETAAIPIIMVTTRSEADNVEACFKSGCSDYVNKPINNAELIAKVKSVLGE